MGGGRSPLPGRQNRCAGFSVSDYPFFHFQFRLFSPVPVL